VTASDEIRNLLGRYCECMDGGDFDGIGALFAAATLADEHGTPIAQGAEAVTAFYRLGTQLYDGTPRTKHLVSNSVIDLDEPAGHAVVRSSYVVFQQTPALPLQAIIAGRYQDTFEHAEGAWRFTERRFFVDLLGDLSQHLRYEVR
jgi:SnoaL-like domain